MDDRTADSAGANQLRGRGLRMLTASVSWSRFAQCTAGSVLLLVVVAWQRTLVSGAQVEPPDYRAQATIAESREVAEPEMEIIPRRLLAPDADNRPPVNYRKAEPPLSPPATAFPSRKAPSLREQLPDTDVPSQPESPRRRRVVDRDETAEKLVRPAPVAERAEPLMLHGGRRRASVSGPGAKHGEIAVPLILGPEDKVPHAVPQDLEEVLPSADEPMQEEPPASAPIAEKPPLVVREEMPFWDPKFAIPAAPSPLLPESGSRVPVAEIAVPAPDSAAVIHSTPLAAGGAETAVPPERRSAAGNMQIPGAAAVTQPMLLPPQWPGTNSAGVVGPAGAPVAESSGGMPVLPNAGWTAGSAGSVENRYGGMPGPAGAGGWQPTLPQQFPGYQLPMRPDSYRSITSGGMTAGGMSAGSRYGQLAGSGRQAGVPTPPGSRYGSLPSARASVQAPPPAISRYGSGAVSGGRTGMAYAGRPTVPQPMPQYVQMPQQPQPQTRYGAVGSVASHGRPYVGYGAVPQTVPQMQQTVGPAAGRSPGVSTAGRSQPLPSGAAGAAGIPTRAAPVSSSRYGAPAATGVRGSVQR